MEFASAKEYKPVLLEIVQVDSKQGKGVCEIAYVGFMSHKHIYAKLPTGCISSPEFPKYIRVKRGQTGGSGNYRCLLGHNGSALVRILECPGSTDLSKDGRVLKLSNEDSSIELIEQLWPSNITI